MRIHSRFPASIHQRRSAPISYVLLVDDERLTRESVVASLAKRGVPAVAVASAQEALSVLLHRRDPPFAVVTELTVRGGADSFLDVLQDDPKLRSTTALVFTRTSNPPPVRATFVFQKETDAHRLIVVLDGLAQQYRSRAS